MAEMATLSRRGILGLVILLNFLSGAALAAPVAYSLDTANSKVGFSFHVAGGRQLGTMPVKRARVMLDTKNLAASNVDVVLSARDARTALPFAAAAMLGPLILDTARHPEIRFTSRSVTLGPSGRISGGATLTGDLTIRGVTRPVSLTAEVYRPRGTAADDLKQLTIILTGTISRSAFGASGYPDLVSDGITLDITAVINAK